MNAKEISGKIRALADSERAKHMQLYFKTGPGEYGEGQQFLGITTPQLRNVVKKSFRDTSHAEVQRLLESPWHEERAAALQIWNEQFSRGDEALRQNIFDSYLASTNHIDSWALVDCSAPLIVGRWLEKHPRDILYTLAESRCMWERRIAIVATLHFIRNNDFGDTLRIAEMLLEDREDLIHKATGWMLREVGKRDKETLIAFLNAHAAAMPRTALRYALERFPAERRSFYMKLPRCGNAQNIRRIRHQD